MAKTVTLTLQIPDARPILHHAAYDAAYFSALVDYVTTKTANRPGGFANSLADAKVEWNRKFLRARRVVNSFGMDYERIPEEEVINPKGYVPYEGGTRKLEKVGGVSFVRVEGSKPNYKKAGPMFRGEAFRAACKVSAERVVTLWLKELNREEPDASPSVDPARAYFRGEA